MGKDIL